MVNMLTVYVLGLLMIFAGVSCYENLLVGDLNPEIVKDLKELSLTRYSCKQDGCPRTLPYQPKFFLYTRSTTEPEELEIGDAIGNLHKKTIMLIHGWISGSNSSAIKRLKDAYLARYDADVILVDWSDVAWTRYINAYCYLPRTANSIAKFLCNSTIPLNDLHVVGHGMGGQIAGVVSNFVNIKCKKLIGRITGLDPAGPHFQSLPERRRLDKGDANFVDVIHTDLMRFGYSGNMGHVDFHVNCGLHQPGCPGGEVTEDTSVADVLCNQNRALEYMIESIFSDRFLGISCGMCPRICAKSLFSDTVGVMGENAVKPKPFNSKYIVYTKRSSPYAVGTETDALKLP